MWIDIWNNLYSLGSWKQRDFPELVAMETMIFFSPFNTASTDSFWAGLLKPTNPKSSFIISRISLSLNLFMLNTGAQSNENRKKNYTTYIKFILKNNCYICKWWLLNLPKTIFLWTTWSCCDGIVSVLYMQLYFYWEKVAKSIITLCAKILLEWLSAATLYIMTKCFRSKRISF